MNRIILNPLSLEALPTRNSQPKQWKLDLIEEAFVMGTPNSLPEIILFETRQGLLVADGNHRILSAMKHSKPIFGIQLSLGEEFLLRGKPSLNYGSHKEYLYCNYGATLSYILLCRSIALALGFRDFQKLYDSTMLSQ